MQEMNKLNLGAIRVVEWHLLTVGISPSYIDWVYHGEPVNLCKDIERVDEGTTKLF